MREDSWKRAIRILWMGQYLTTAGLTVVVPLLPFYMEELGVRGREAVGFWTGVSLAAPAVTLGIAGPLWGWLGDRCGRKWMVARALFGLAISILLMGLARTPLEFLLCRLLQGACGGVVDASAAFAAAEVPEASRGKALGVLQSSIAAGSLTGPLLGGLLASQWGLRSLLLGVGLLTACTGIAAGIFLWESHKPAVRERRRASVRELILGLLRTHGTRSFLLAGLCAQAGAYGLVAVFAPHVRQVLSDPGQAPMWVGALQAVTWSAAALGAIWWGRRNDQLPLARNLFLAASGCALSVALQAFPMHPLWLVPLRILQGFCFGAIVPTVYLQISRVTGSAHCGVGMGAANSFLTQGQILGALVAAFLSSWVTPPLIFGVMAGFFALSAVLVVLLRETPGPVSSCH